MWKSVILPKMLQCIFFLFYLFDVVPNIALCMWLKFNIYPLQVFSYISTKRNRFADERKKSFKAF